MKAPLKARQRKRCITALAIIAVVIILVVATYALTRPAPGLPVAFKVGASYVADTTGAGPDPCSGSPSAPQNVTSYGSPTIANYDKQVWAISNQNTNSLSFNVTAVEQSDASGYGPAYLLNGYTNRGYWYQVGISWHWVVPSYVGYYNNFDFFIQVYHGNTELVNSLSKIIIHGGDKVLLRISLSKGDNQVVMSAHDWNTGAANTTSWSAFGATKFVGGLQNTEYPTGLLLEAYGQNLVCGLNNVTFTAKSTYPGFGLRIDEWNLTGTSAQGRFASGHPQWSYPANGIAPTETTNGCITYLETTACLST